MLAFGLAVLLGTAFSSFWSRRWLVVGVVVTEAVVAIGTCAAGLDLFTRAESIASVWLAYQLGVGIMIGAQLLRPDPAAASR